jgi:hypothetical protein
MPTVSPPPAPPVRLRRSFIVRHPLVAYFTLAYLLSWAVEIPLLAAAQGWTTRTIPLAFHYLAACGPLVAALIVTWMTDGSEGVRRLWRSVARWRVRPVWWLCAVAPLVLFGTAAVVLRFVRGSWTDVELLGRVNYLPDLGFGAWRSGSSPSARAVVQ